MASHASATISCGRQLVLVVAMALAFAACGTVDEVQVFAGEMPDGASTTTTSATPDDSSVDEGDGADGDESEGDVTDSTDTDSDGTDSDGTDSSTSVPEGDGSDDDPADGDGDGSGDAGGGAGDAGRPPGSTEFVAADQAYAMSIGVDWEELTDVAANVDAWLVAPPVDGFDTNITVVVNRTEAADMDAVVDGAVEEYRALGDYEILSSEQIVVTHGNELAILRLTADVDGQTISFDQILGLWDVAVDGVLTRSVIIATLASPDPAAFETYRPMLLTLRKP